MQIIEKLDKAVFNTAIDSDTISGTLLGKDVEVDLRTKFTQHTDYVKKFDLFVQVILTVKIDGEVVVVWGSESIDDINTIVKWFLKKHSDAVKNECSIKDWKRYEGQRFFDSI